MGKFDDRATFPARGPADMFRWKVMDSLAGRRKLGGGDKFTPPVRENSGAILKDDRASLTFIGHATFAAKLGGKVWVTDPIWSARVAGTVPRQSPPGIAFENLPPIDVVTVTHNHFDHLDLPTLKRIGPRALFVVPIGAGYILRDAALPRVIELDWWQTTREGSLEITLVPARHWSMRMPWTRNESLWGGFVVRGPEATIYHAGDTAFFDGFAEIGRRMGTIDYALLPIGAYEPRWFMEPQHMNPEEAGEAFLALQAKNLVAMHWGTFKLTDEPLDEPPARIRRWWYERNLDPKQLRVLDFGETILLI
jgi:L-ascorbate metabolism protein UlaG (beta-lactamase superfamily)